MKDEFKLAIFAMSLNLRGGKYKINTLQHVPVYKYSWG